MTWEAVIGLEIHAQLATRSKLFSSASTAYGAPPNTQACAVDVALPGVLPVLNREAVAMAIKFGLAIGAQIAGRSIFARKNYFYPDLPKGYQISQYETPVVAGGGIRIELADGNTKSVRITRAHLEEDAGKSLHEDFEGFTGIDLNRAGTPLLEIVSEPDLRSPAEAAAYMRKVHSLVRYLDICDGNMQEGSFRCDANVSVRRLGDDQLGTRTELKNINSFRFVEKAIELEIDRQIALVEAGGRVRQETLLYDADRHQTRVMRGKEEANDYRYFPDPDLLPLVIDPAWIAQVRASMPELPDAKTARFMDAYGLRAADAAALTVERDLADYFEAVAACVPTASQLAANWVIGELTGALNRDRVSIQQAPIRARDLGRLLQLILDATISGKIAKEVFAALWTGEGTPDEIVERRGLTQMSDAAALETIVAQVIADNPAQLAQYRAGKDKLFGFFVGQVMRETQGKANPAQVNELLGRLLRS